MKNFTTFMKRYREGLTSKFELANYLNVFKNEYDLLPLIKIRNDAIHAGKVVESNEAAEALKITDDIIYSEITHLF